MEINRRRFERLEINEDAVAIDEHGRELGKISQASGGGMLIMTTSKEMAESLKVGQKLRVTVLEPGTASASSLTIDVVVRYHDGKAVGLEFGSPKQD